jgi:hypothetical protein
MPSITLTIALLVWAGLGILSAVRPTIYLKLNIGVVVAGALTTGYALGVLIGRTFFHQDWRLFQDDILILSLFYALLLGRTSRRPVNEKPTVIPAPANAPSPAKQEPPASRLYRDAPAEELREKLLTLEGKRRQKSDHLLAQKNWLAGVEEQYQDLMGRFQDARSDDERSAALDSLRRVTEDRERARLELRGTEQSLEGLEREIRTVNAILTRQNRPH